MRYQTGQVHLLLTANRPEGELQRLRGPARVQQPAHRIAVHQMRRVPGVQTANTRPIGDPADPALADRRPLTPTLEQLALPRCKVGQTQRDVPRVIPSQRRAQRAGVVEPGLELRNHPARLVAIDTPAELGIDKPEQRGERLVVHQGGHANHHRPPLRVGHGDRAQTARGPAEAPFDFGAGFGGQSGCGRWIRQCGFNNVLVQAAACARIPYECRGYECQKYEC